MQNNTDDLLQRAQKFDQTALAEIYDKYSSGLYSYAMRLLGDARSAEDCVSETFSRFLQALHKGKGPRQHLQAYLYRISHNWITDTYRRKIQDYEEINENFQDSDTKHPVQISDQALRQKRLREALSQLTPDQRQVLVLKYVEELDNAVVARVIGKPIGAVKSLQHRGLAALRKVLENE